MIPPLTHKYLRGFSCPRFCAGQMSQHDMAEFVRESNWIEGIRREPLYDEINAHYDLVYGPTIGILELQAFVSVIQPDAVLRDSAGLNVRVGKHVAPPGGAEIVTRLERMFNQMKAHGDGPERAWTVHCEYEWIHPFTDGNGRSGRPPGQPDTAFHEKPIAPNGTRKARRPGRGGISGCSTTANLTWS